MARVDTHSQLPMTSETETRGIGRTGVRVSSLGIGAGSLAGAEGDRSFDAVVGEAWSHGLRYFDTAPLYLAGESEVWIGRALEGRARSEATISTKIGRYPAPGGSHHDYTRDATLRSIDLSLSRLKTSYIDIVFIHDVDPDLLGSTFEAHYRNALDGAYRVLDDLRRDGTVRAVGCAVKYWEVCLRFGQDVQMDCYMLPGGYTLLKQDCLPLLDHCLSAQSSVLVASPFNTGILATGPTADARYFYKPAPAEILERTRQIDAVCRCYSVPLAAAALRFPVRHLAVSSVVAGHAKPQEVDQNLSLLRHAIPDQCWMDLDAIPRPA
jgi:D-threo-aldose 1-dehydrogenase